MATVVKRKNLSEPIDKRPLTSDPRAFAEELKKQKAAKSKANGHAAAAVPTIPREALNPPKRELAKVIESRVMLPIDQMERHPINRVPTPVAITARAASLADDGQLEDVVVRKPGFRFKPRLKGIPAGEYEIISGETRVRAGQQLGWTTIRCTVIECSDAEALRLVADYNGQREDLNAIERAMLIEALCKSTEEGGSDMTREEAATSVGLKTGSAATNLVRLLKLPAVWQQRVAAGELGEAMARELLAVVELGPVMEALEKDWEEREEAVNVRWNENAFQTPGHLKESIQDFVHECCRRLDRKIWTGTREAKLAIDADDPATRERLGIVEVKLPTGRKGESDTVLVATNVKAFDKLVEEQKTKASKASAAKSGADEKPAKRELSREELKHKKSERTKLLKGRIADWRDKLLRMAIIAKLDAWDEKLEDWEDNGWRLVMAYAANPCYRGPSMHDLLEAATGNSFGRHSYRNAWPAVASVSRIEAQENVTRAMAKRLLEQDSTDWKSPIVPHELIEAYAADLHVDLGRTWLDLQTTASTRIAGHDFLEQFLLFHQSDELVAQAKEWGTAFEPNVTRKRMIGVLLSQPVNSTRRLPLPKSIEPLAIATPAKAKSTKATKKGGK